MKKLIARLRAASSRREMVEKRLLNYYPLVESWGVKTAPSVKARLHQLVEYHGRVNEVFGALCKALIIEARRVPAFLTADAVQGMLRGFKSPGVQEFVTRLRLGREPLTYEYMIAALQELHGILESGYLMAVANLKAIDKNNPKADALKQAMPHLAQLDPDVLAGTIKTISSDMKTIEAQIVQVEKEIAAYRRQSDDERAEALRRGVAEPRTDPAELIRRQAAKAGLRSASGATLNPHEWLRWLQRVDPEAWSNHMAKVRQDSVTLLNKTRGGGEGSDQGDELTAKLRKQNDERRRQRLWREIKAMEKGDDRDQDTGPGTRNIRATRASANADDMPTNPGVRVRP